MVRPSNRSKSNITRGILLSSSVHGMWGCRKTSCDGLANKKELNRATYQSSEKIKDEENEPKLNTWNVPTGAWAKS